MRTQSCPDFQVVSVFNNHVCLSVCHVLLLVLYSMLIKPLALAADHCTEITVLVLASCGMCMNVSVRITAMGELLSTWFRRTQSQFFPATRIQATRVACRARGAPSSDTHAVCGDQTLQWQLFHVFQPFCTVNSHLLVSYYLLKALWLVTQLFYIL